MVVKLYRRACTMYIQIYLLVNVYVQITYIYVNLNVYILCIYISLNAYTSMYIVHTTYIYVYLCTCTYMDIREHKFMNMYIHVCTMFRHVYTVLQYPVQVGRIPDDEYVLKVVLT